VIRMVKSRIVNLIRKEFQQLRRDRRLLAIALISPVLQLVLLGYAANMDVERTPTVVLDQDRSEYSRLLLSRMFSGEQFVPAGYVENDEQVGKALDEGSASVGIIIPHGFARDIRSGDRAEVQILLDGTDSTAAMVGQSYAEMIVKRFSAEMAAGGAVGAIAGGLVSPVARVWYNPALESRNFIVPGVLALLMMVMTTLLTSLAIVKEREVGTLEQLIVTPLRSFEIMLGKIIPFALIGMVDVCLVVFVVTVVFGIPVQGSVPLLFGLAGIFLLTTLGLGMLISTISHTQQQAMITAVFFVMLPMIFLSGFVFPIENMPPPIQYLTYILPLRYFFVIIRGLFLKGVGLSHLWDEAVILLVFGLVIFLVSALRFRGRLE